VGLWIPAAVPETLPREISSGVFSRCKIPQAGHLDKTIGGRRRSVQHHAGRMVGVLPCRLWAWPATINEASCLRLATWSSRKAGVHSRNANSSPSPWFPRSERARAPMRIGCSACQGCGIISSPFPGWMLDIEFVGELWIAGG